MVIGRVSDASSSSVGKGQLAKITVPALQYENTKHDRDA
jgi:hypothetical protein